MKKPASKKVSAVIPCYNVEKYISEVVEGVLKQSFNLHELLLIDDGSTDRTSRILRKFEQENSKVRIITHQFNLGLSAARNTGIVSSSGDFIAFLDGDAVPDKNWLSNIMRLFNEQNKKLAGVCGRLIDKFTDTLSDRWRARHMCLDFGNQAKQVPFLPGANAVYRREHLIKVGMYDTSNRTAGDDIYMGERLRAAGYELFFQPDALCYHLRKDNLFSVVRTRWGWANAKKNIKCPDVYSLFSLLFKTVAGFGWALKCFAKDLEPGYRSLIGIDLFMPFYWTYYTFKKYLNFKNQEFRSIFGSLRNF